MRQAMAWLWPMPAFPEESYTSIRIFPLHLFRQETFMCGFLRIILHRKIRCCVYARRADAFDAETTWNHQEWKVDENVSALMAEGKIRDCIVVGVWNIAESRFHDYFRRRRLTICLKQNFVSSTRNLTPRG